MKPLGKCLVLLGALIMLVGIIPYPESIAWAFFGLIMFGIGFIVVAVAAPR